jgi:acyl-coenzyme A synthetase/AMP-(fatty) acid ligase
MHFHRDLLIVADGYAREVLNVTPDDVFVGSPSLAFTFGLGGPAIFPLRFGATATLLENPAPGRLSFVARSDDMIVSSGYNIAGPEIEAALLTHRAVAECGVVGAPDEARGMIVKAYVG